MTKPLTGEYAGLLDEQGVGAQLLRPGLQVLETLIVDHPRAPAALPIGYDFVRLSRHFGENLHLPGGGIMA